MTDPRLDIIFDLGRHAANRASETIIDVAERAPNGTDSTAVVLVALHILSIKLKVLTKSHPSMQGIVELLEAMTDTSKVDGEISKLKKAFRP